jgi:glycosyltransferase involved in cell wall biosynthesis
VIPNGFDPVQFENPTLPQGAEAHCGWHLLHAGALYYGRSVAALLQAIRQLVNADPDFARDVRLTLLGTLDAGAQREIERSGLASRVHVVAQADHAAAIAAMRCADALLLVANTTPGAEATVPGKVFEYLAVGRPILAIAPPESSTADVLHSTGGGWLAAAGSVDSIVCALKDAYTCRNLRPDATEVARFDRRRLAANLAQVFDEVTECATRRI